MPRESKPFTKSFHVPCSAGVAHSHLYVRYGRSPLHQIRQAGRGRAPHPREVLNNYTMDSFQYEPLQPNGNQVRLLCFSDDPGGQPGYTLKTFDINECPPYDALSYMWGPPLPTRIISLNKRSFEVRKNLWDFLDRIERTDITVLDKGDCHLLHPTYLWIDQICIDQSSMGEKSHQVKRMSEIYKQSQRVIVWLGCDDPHSNTAMRLLADIRLVQQPFWGIDSPGFLRNLWGAMSIDYENNLHGSSIIATALRTSCIDHIGVASGSSKSLC